MPKEAKMKISSAFILSVSGFMLGFALTSAVLAAIL
jgi:hypothetical protein